MAKTQPQTIEELRQWYVDHKLPPEQVTRFFIGKNIKEPRAFGIYKDDNGDFVVYKNKANGERAVRYQGSDEGYAVNELYQRLRTEIAEQKKNNAARNQTSNRPVRKSARAKRIGSTFSKIMKMFLYVQCGASFFAVAMIFLASSLDHSPSRGYYRYNGKDYYYQKSHWYEYQADDDDWLLNNDCDFLNDLITDDTAAQYRIYDHEGARFEDSTWYDDYSSSTSSSDDSYNSNDWDSGSSWDSNDSWDSGTSDWDSDW
ncbi:MAG: hypothetical protein K5739_01195 [Lachnospiraceae bacterium]|nr:hypothetical protein [Lachnospiraceae bacterium]